MHSATMGTSSSAREKRSDHHAAHLALKAQVLMSYFTVTDVIVYHICNNRLKNRINILNSKQLIDK